MQFLPGLLHDAYSVIEDPAIFASSRETAAKSVVTWRFASGDMSIVEPFAKELYGSKARWKKEGVKPGKRDLRHGFDASQRLRLVETQEGEHICHIEYADTHSLRYGHLPPIPNPCVRRFEFDGKSQLVRQYMLYAGHGCQVEYNWQDGVLMCIESIGWTQSCKTSEMDWDDVKIDVNTHIHQQYGCSPADARVGK